MVFGYDYAWIGLVLKQGAPALVQCTCREAAKGTPQEGVVIQPRHSGGTVWLRVTVSEGGQIRFASSLDGTHFTTAAGEFTATAGRWVGAKVGLFATGQPGAHADFDWIRFAPL